MGGVQVDSRVDVITRTEFVGRFVLELIDDLMGREGEYAYYLEELILKGVVENQLVGSFCIDYIKSGKALGQVTIEIDWKEHALNIDRFGEKIRLAPGKTTQEQVSQAIVQLVSYLKDYQTRTDARPRLTWAWRHGVDSQKAAKIMGSAVADRLPRHEGRPQDLATTGAEDVKYNFVLRLKKLSEVLIHGWIVDPNSPRHRQ